MNKMTSKSLEHTISRVLQVGVVSSALIILAGVILLFTHNYQHQSSYHQLTTNTYSFPQSISTLKSSVSKGAGIGFIELGVLLLILTPILRVATSILLFIRIKDLPMTLITLCVLIVLVSSFILGILAK